MRRRRRRRRPGQLLQQVRPVAGDHERMSTAQGLHDSVHCRCAGSRSLLVGSHSGSVARYSNMSLLEHDSGAVRPRTWPVELVSGRGTRTGRRRVLHQQRVLDDQSCRGPAPRGRRRIFPGARFRAVQISSSMRQVDTSRTGSQARPTMSKISGAARRAGDEGVHQQQLGPAADHEIFLKASMSSAGAPLERAA